MLPAKHFAAVIVSFLTLATIYTSGIHAAPLPEGASVRIEVAAPEGSPTSNGAFGIDWGPTIELSDIGDDHRVEYEIRYRAEGGTDAVWYRGFDRESYITGFEDGVYIFQGRLRLVDGAGDAASDWTGWSAPVNAEVLHTQLSVAVGFLVVGAVIFLVLAGFISVQAVRAVKGDTTVNAESGAA